MLNNLVPDIAGMIFSLEKVFFCVLSGQIDLNLSLNIDQ